MALVLVKGMPLEPHSCAACGGGPRDGDGNIVEAVFAEAVDINWGDSLYICKTCSRVIAELWEFETPEEVEKLKKRIEELEAIEEAHEVLKARVRKMLDGSRARKEVADATQ